MSDSITHLQGDTVPVAFHVWLRNMGVTQVTGWRWRKHGWIDTINIAGRLYVTPKAVAKFSQRAVAGEFARVHPTPSRPALVAA